MWYQIKLNAVTTIDPELLSDALTELGALSVTFTDNQDTPVLEPLPGCTPLWPQTDITALFNDSDMRNSAALTLKANYANLELELSEFADEQWERAWMDAFKPMQFGSRLWVCPSNHQPPEPDACNILLDPGLAFGTGTHATTALCLGFLDGAELNDKVVCDYGCGSGILAIAALKLGAAKAYATDIDEQALIATKDNATRNEIDDARLSLNIAKDFQAPPVDLLMANILAEPLVALAPRFFDYLKPGGTIILSGIIEEQKDSVKQAYLEAGFTISASSSIDEWQLIVARKR